MRTTSPSLNEPAVVGRFRRTERFCGSWLSLPKVMPLPGFATSAWSCRSTSKLILTGVPREQKLFFASFCADCEVSGFEEPSAAQESSMGWCSLMESKGNAQAGSKTTAVPLYVAGVAVVCEVLGVSNAMASGARVAAETRGCTPFFFGIRVCPFSDTGPVTDWCLHPSHFFVSSDPMPAPF